MFNRGELLKKIRALPLREVIQTTLERDPSRDGLQNDPEEIGFLCPFHGDRNGGNFHIFTDKNGVEKYHCFVCDSKVAMGDAVDFVKNFKRCGFNEAMLTVAAQAELISPEEYQRELGKQFTGKTARMHANSHVPGRKLASKPEMMIHLVYSLLARGPQLVDPTSKKLSAEDYEYLLSRGIQDEEIQNYGYFTFPDSEKAIEEIFKVLHAKGFPKEELLGIPGFWRETKTGSVRLVSMDGIGIPLRNPNNMIVSLQVRARGAVKASGPRYKFLSSSFTAKAKYRDECSDGCSPALTTSVVTPLELQRNDCVAITEGQFKAAQFALNFGAYAITVQGVNNTKDVLPYLQALCKKGILSERPRILIGFDMDMYENVNVLAAAFKLRKTLEEAGYQVSYLFWPEKYGKGLDDCIIAGHAASVHEIEASDFESGIFAECFRKIQESRPGVKRMLLCRTNSNEFMLEFNSGMTQKFIVPPERRIEFLKMEYRGQGQK